MTNITRTDLDHFFKQDFDWFGPDYKGAEQIYNGLLKVINNE